MKRFLIVITYIFISLPSISLGAEQDFLIQREEDNREKRQLIEKIERDLKPQDFIQDKFFELELKEIDSKAKCLNIKKINIENSKNIKTKFIKNLKTQYENNCLNLNEIYNIVTITNNHLIKRGLVTSKATLDYKLLNQNILNIIIIEPKISQIFYDSKEKKTFKNKLEIFTSFGNYKNKILNIKDIEQGLWQMNRIKGSQASMKIVPSKKNGYSNIVITRNKAKYPLDLNLTYDNSGSKSTGENKGKINSNFYNILGLNEIISLSLNKDTKSADGKYSKSNFISFNIPLHYWNFYTSYARSSYKNTIPLSSNSTISEGISKNYKFKIERSLIRNKKQNLQINSSLKLTESNSFQDGFFIDNQSRRLTSLTAGIYHKITHKLTNYIYSINLHKGMSWFDAKRDEPNQKYNDFTAQFSKIDFNFSIYKSIKSFLFKTSLNGQYSNHHLYSTEQIFIGDEYSVRGFKNESAGGDSGFYFNNEVSFTPKIFKKNKLTKNAQIFAGLDFGMVRKRGGKTTEINTGKDYLSGAAIGLKNSHKNLDYKLTIAKALNRPIFLEDEGSVFYASSTLRF